MGNPFSAIEAEEKALRMNEARAEIYETVSYIENIDSEDGLAILKKLTEKMEKTCGGDSDDEEGISDKDNMLTKLPWDEVERAEDKEKVKKECQRLVKQDALLTKLKPQLAYAFDFDLDQYVFLAVVLSAFFPKLNN